MPQEIASDVMAFVGCIAGAIMIDEYQQGLLDAGFSHVQVLDAGSDLNAYSKVEGQSACCSPPMSPSTGLPTNGTTTTCCSPRVETSTAGTVHAGLAELLSRYDVNDYAASVKVFAVKSH